MNMKNMNVRQSNSKTDFHCISGLVISAYLIESAREMYNNKMAVSPTYPYSALLAGFPLRRDRMRNTGLIRWRVHSPEGETRTVLSPAICREGVM